MITAQEAQTIRARLDALHAWHKANAFAAPTDLHVSNGEISALEIFDFIQTPPTKYFLYIDERTNRATTWMGETLGTVTFGRSWRSNFGDRRTSITVRAINGRTYTGTFYRSSGDYARIRLIRRATQET